MLSLAILSAFIASAAAHGYVQGIVASGTYYVGYNPSFQWRNPVPIVAGWSAPEDIDNGFIDPTKFSDPNIVCHRSATPAGIAAKIVAGDTVELQWTVWPESHHGPVLDYIAKCPGESCEGVDKTKLEFVKIGEAGMNHWDKMPGDWASDDLISNNNSWSITIPGSLAMGSYVLRHEIISLHSANNNNGAQNYPQCINLDITSSSGTEDLSSAGGIPAIEFYDAKDPGIFVNIYESQSTYQIPGPTLWSGAANTAAKQTPMKIESYAPWVTGSSTTEDNVQPTAYTSSTPYGGGQEPTITQSPLLTTTTKTITQSGPSPYSKIQALINALPSGALTNSIAAPTATVSTEQQQQQWGGKPDKELPEGWTLKDLLQWVQWSMKQAWQQGKGDKEKNQGRHSRDFGKGRG